MKDPYNSLKPVETLAIVARTNGTVNGAGVDRNLAGKMYQAAVIVVHTGTMTDGSHAVTIQESDDNSSWTNVAAGDLQGVAPTIVSTDDNVIFTVGYRGLKRYVRAIVVTSGATTGGIFGAQALLADPRVLPAG